MTVALNQSDKRAKTIY